MLVLDGTTWVYYVAALKTDYLEYLYGKPLVEAISGE